jgi:deoxycytidylate deaminase
VGNDCLKSLASYGIKRIVYRNDYKSSTAGSYDPQIIAKDFEIEIIKLT